MSNLKENLSIPQIGGELIAYHTRKTRYKTNESEDVFYWRVKFVFNGPDARYNPAVSELNIDQINRLLKALDESYQKMKQLQSQSFLGTFSKTIDDFSNLTIELKAGEGRVYVNLWLSTETWRFAKSLFMDDLTTAIDKLRTVEQQGLKLTESLKALV